MHDVRIFSNGDLLKDNAFGEDIFLMRMFPKRVYLAKMFLDRDIPNENLR